MRLSGHAVERIEENFIKKYRITVAPTCALDLLSAFGSVITRYKDFHLIHCVEWGKPFTFVVLSIVSLGLVRAIPGSHSGRSHPERFSSSRSPE